MPEWLTYDKVIIALVTPVAFFLLATVWRFFSAPLSEVGEVINKELDRKLEDWTVCGLFFTAGKITITVSPDHIFMTDVLLCSESVFKVLTLRDKFFLHPKCSQVYSELLKAKNESEKVAQQRKVQEVLSKYHTEVSDGKDSV